MQKQKGFTIIELIVVIAIIAVLATIVMINVTQYIAKGRDASIKGNMASMQTVAATFYDNNSDYDGLDSDPSMIAAVAAVNDAVKPEVDEVVVINSANTAWCFESALTESGNWCVDSTGYKGTTAECDTTNADCAATVTP